MSKQEEQTHTQEGTVAFYSPKFQYGFITPKGSKEKENDVFFHKDGIEEGNKVNKGDKVLFIIQEVKENDKGPVATGVKKVEEETQ